MASITVVECKHCGKLFDRGEPHMIYAFVGRGIKETVATEICPQCTDLMDPSRR